MKNKILISGWFLFLLILVFWDRHLFGDGSHYLLGILSKKGFFHINWVRVFAEKTTQLPIAFSILLGVKNLNVLSYIFGLSLYLPSFICLFVCRYLMVNKKDIYIYIAMYLFLFMNTSLFIISEIHLCLVIFWVLLVSINSKRLGSLKYLPFHFGICILFIRSYEAGVLFGPILSFYSFKKIKVFEIKKMQLAQFANSVTFISGMCAFAISLHGIFFPRDANNLVIFYETFFNIFKEGSFWLSLSIFALILTPSNNKSLVKSLVYLLLVCLGLFPLLGTISDPFNQYYGRFFNLIIPSAFAVIYMSKYKDKMLKFNPGSINLLMLFSISIMSYHLQIGYRWSQYIAKIDKEINQQKNIIPFQESILNDSKSSVLNQFNSSWAIPSLCVLRSAMEYKEIKGIITNKDETNWQPFNPRDGKGALPNLEHYGVNTRSEL